MPKLPNVEPFVGQRELSSAERAGRVAKFLAHRSSGAGDSTVFAPAIRDWFAANPEAKAAFIEWYEKQP